ncbi:SipW-dependent-type signal peptide-containing protein [Prescottella defluvii]|uniref:SipW-dependent-type signal peptide-containing protein n=1 Tax=Prescottella defluvii TaxID=1323361 RepID=UPI001E5327FA|nr:SipW-dependent-type signal peptide-containing protein [Prescottella defluvii]
MRGRISHGAWTRTRAVLSLGMVLGLGAVGTMAAWSNSATATSGVFSTGSIQLKLNGDRPSHAFTALEKTSILKGNSVAAMLPVQNTGAVDFAYVAKATANGDAGLASSLTVAVYDGGSSNNTTCSGGTLIDSKALSTAAPVDLIPSRTLTKAEGTENLCFQITLSSTAPDTTRMKYLGAAFEFTATEVPSGA